MSGAAPESTPDAPVSGDPVYADPWFPAPLEQIFNLRDVGGRRTVTGRWVRTGVLYRSDSLHRLTEADREVVGSLGFRAVLDLRTEAEIDRTGRFEVDDVTRYHHLPVARSVLDPEPPPQDAHADCVADWYVKMVTGGAPVVARALTVLAASDNNPAVFHCTSGTDRTGVLAAIVQDLIGMSEHDIVSDYALSQEAVDRWTRWAATADTEAVGRWRNGRFAPIHPSPDVMRSFLDRLRTGHGSVEGFVAGLDVPDGTVDRLRAHLLAHEPPSPAVA